VRSGVPLQERIEARCFYKNKLGNAVGEELDKKGEGKRGREKER
jgi:hypothetical protein